jgi:PAS domain-containing protein
MPLWKQRMFARLMKPADGEGGDLGGGASGDTSTDSASDDAGTPAGDDDAGTGADPQASASDEPAGDTSTEDLPTDKPQSAKMLALLDELSGDKPAEKPADEPKADDKPAGDPSAADKPPVDPTQPKTAEQEEAELLEGVKSERGRERIKAVFAERKQLEADITEFRDLVKSTGMSAQEFAQTLEFGRLVSSNDEKNIRVALEMIETQRAALYQKLGVEAPGVDLLAGHDDLKSAVENMEITRDKALELAKFRKSQADVTQRQQAETERAQSQEQYRQTVQSAATAMETYLSTRAKEADHPARLKIIGEHFQNAANLQRFVQSFEPKQWTAALQMMYDGIVVPKAAPTNQAQPLRSRPAQLGAPAAQGNSPMDRVAQHLDNLGI